MPMCKKLIPAGFTLKASKDAAKAACALMERPSWKHVTNQQSEELKVIE